VILQQCNWYIRSIPSICYTQNSSTATDLRRNLA